MRLLANNHISVNWYAAALSWPVITAFDSIQQTGFQIGYRRCRRLHPCKVQHDVEKLGEGEDNVNDKEDKNHDTRNKDTNAVKRNQDDVGNENISEDYICQQSITYRWEITHIKEHLVHGHQSTVDIEIDGTVEILIRMVILILTKSAVISSSNPARWRDKIPNSDGNAINWSHSKPSTNITDTSSDKLR